MQTVQCISERPDRPSFPSARDPARGLACILLVVFHAIGNEPTAGMHVARDSGLHFFAQFFTYIRMPLFSFLSGFVYAYHPVLKATRGQFVQSKWRRLLVPMITAATVTLLVEVLRGQQPLGNSPAALAMLANLPAIYLYPYHHFWFLQALFVVFLVLIVLEGFGALATLPRYLSVMAVAAAAFLLVPDSSNVLFSLAQAVYIWPFFLLGVGANRYREVLLSPRAQIGCLTVFTVGAGIQALNMFLDPAHEVYRRAALALATGLAANLCIIAWLPRSRLLQFVGRYSFCIYLYHSLFLNTTRHLTHVGHILHPWMVLPFLAMAGLGLPVILQRVAEHWSVSRRLVLGDWRAASSRGVRIPPEPLAAAVTTAGAWSVGATTLLGGRWKSLDPTQRMGQDI